MFSVIYLRSGFLKGKIVVILKSTICKMSQEFSSLVGSRSFYFPVFTSQHRVHQVHKSTRYFHQNHAAFPQFVSYLSNFWSDLNLYNFHQVSPKTGPSLILSMPNPNSATLQFCEPRLLRVVYMV